ncbi:MAG: ribonuclease P protein component [Parcubacteria group bacterium]
MLPKSNRLKKENDFRKILRGGESARGNFLVLKAARNSLGKVRVGISVSKKISKKATLRNKIKRRLAACLKPKIPQIKEGLDLFLIALPGLETKNFSETKKECDSLFKKARILKNDGEIISKNN